MQIDTSELARLAGQVIVAGFPAGAPPESLLALARADALGGFILFKRNIEDPAQVARLNETLRSAFPEPAQALLAVDQEGGRVARLGAPVLALPPMRALGQLDDPALTADALQALGRQLWALGFNVNMAPVLDVDTNPDNPVIGDRSFGADPQCVIRHGRAVIDGLARAGVAACGKHFPGHGDTLQDSHLSLPRLAHARARLDRVELRPFAELVNEMPAIMTAHVVFDSLAPGLPATLSPAVITDLLRNELGFPGVIFSDDLEMRALSDHMTVEDAAVRAIEAGCDALLICSDVARSLAAHAALTARAADDSAFATRLREAAGRVRALGRRFPGATSPRTLPGVEGMARRLSARLVQAG